MWSLVPVEGKMFWRVHFLGEQLVQCRMAVDTLCIFRFEEVLRQLQGDGPMERLQARLKNLDTEGRGKVRPKHNISFTLQITSKS